MNKYNLYEKNDAIYLLVNDTTFELMFDTEGYPNWAATDPISGLKSLVTPITESYRDQPYKFGEDLEFCDREDFMEDETYTGKFAVRRLFSEYPLTTMAFGTFKYARKSNDKDKIVLVDGVKMVKWEAIKKRKELLIQLAEYDAGLSGDE